MNTVISVKVDKEIKKQAQEIAKSVGIPLSTLINAYLRQLVVTRKVELYAPEQMTPEMEKLIARAEKEIAAGEISGPFKTSEEFVASLNK
ncbi:MAG: type II toxin-antitoxin system RelB/DinJ family antitoxin [Candidatus Pacebacteria bacterium]|jgi:addiction module RelB/DinJ family antitoxin|nr:type II toxin-antitoxin system RelB/DinJ family antitoxin [Candidatus Paceibacterota bacterium]